MLKDAEQHRVEEAKKSLAAALVKFMPVSFLFSSGITMHMVLAAPVLEGMMFSRMPRPPRQSLFDGPPVTRPRLMRHLSLSTFFTMGARQLVAQLALEMMIACPA
jgi:hypothetical protein